MNDYFGIIDQHGQWAKDGNGMIAYYPAPEIAKAHLDNYSMSGRVANFKRFVICHYTKPLEGRLNNGEQINPRSATQHLEQQLISDVTVAMDQIRSYSGGGCKNPTLCEELLYPTEYNVIKELKIL